MGLIKHVLLDCDGTLYRCPWEFEAKRDDLIYKALAERLGTSVIDASKQYQDRMMQHKTNTVSLKSFGFTNAEAKEIINLFDMAGHIRQDLSLVEMIREIKSRDVLVSIFTNNNRSTLCRIMEKLGLDQDIFTYLLTPEEVKPKPSRDGYREIVRRTSLMPNQIIYVGDREDAETTPARQEGMNTCLVWSETDSLTYDKERMTYHFNRKTIYELAKVVAELDDPGRLQSKVL